MGAVWMLDWMGWLLIVSRLACFCWVSLCLGLVVWFGVLFALFDVVIYYAGYLYCFIIVLLVGSDLVPLLLYWLF